MKILSRLFKCQANTKKELADLTARYNFLSNIIRSMPGHVYWKDIEGKYLGCNEEQAKSAGLTVDEYIGKTDLEMPWKNQVDLIRKVDLQVIKTGSSVETDEPALLESGEIRLFHSKKVPLKDAHGKVIGVLGISFDATEERKQETKANKDKFEAERTLKELISIMPAHIFWYSTDGILLGCNDVQAKAFGYKSAEEMIGTSIYKQKSQEKEDLEILRQVNQEIIKTGEPQTAEEPLKYPDGTEAMFFSKKVPLKDESGVVTGILGIAIDITDRKEKEQLQVEMEVQKALLEEQRENQETIKGFVHDIRSPVSGALMILDKCTELPENKRVPLRKALNRIGDMSKNLLSQYNTKHDPDAFEEKQPVLVSDILLDILTEKRFEYEGLPIKFDHNFKDYFAFINAEPNAFKRSISNLINNAVDAFDGKEGVVTFKLEALKEKVKITIQDNGKGMPPEIIDKLMNHVEVTHGKEGGHGIGFKQIRKTLIDNQGEFKIDSKVGVGTKIILTFPKITAPDWSASGIVLGREDVVVILDDEDAIREAWKMHLEPILKTAPGIEMHVFKMGVEALDFINKLGMDKKSKVFLLTDFELLNQNLNGLDVVEQSHVARSLLVTSHSANVQIQKRAIGLGTKILAKTLAAEEIPIKIDESFKYSTAHHESIEAAPGKPVDIIIVDDDQEFAENLRNFVFSDRAVDCFYNPQEFLKELPKYAKDTRLCIDNNFAGAGGMNGVEVAEQAYKMGYAKLYLLSGDDFKKGELPPYLTAILKTDLASIEKI